MEPAHLEVELSFFPLMLILHVLRPVLSINGRETVMRWGVHRFPLPPGRYQISAWYNYIFGATSVGTIHLDLVPGGVYRLRYRPAWIVFLAGSMTLVQQPLLPAPR